jgi:hypothetical protein
LFSHGQSAFDFTWPGCLETFFEALARRKQTVHSLPNVENHDRDAIGALLAEDEILKNLSNIGDYRCVESVVFAVELCFAFHASQFDVCCFLTH